MLTQAERYSRGATTSALDFDGLRVPFLYSCCEEIDSGDFSRLVTIASMTKCFVTDVAMEVTTEAVQVLGAYGYSKDFPDGKSIRRGESDEDEPESRMVKVCSRSTASSQG